MENKNFAFYANRSTEDVFADLKTSAEGLSHAEAEQRLCGYGPTEINETTITWWEVLKNQIKNLFIFIFVDISGFYFFTQQYTECIILIIIMIIKTLIS